MSHVDKVVHVVWDDATLEAYGSEGMRAEDVSGPLETSSWGLCVVDELTHIAVAAASSREGLFQVTSIPRNMVRRIQVLDEHTDS